MGNGKFGLYGALQPWTRTPDEIIDKSVQRANVTRELDIREGKLKADKEAREAAKIKDYKGEQWGKIPANWSRATEAIKKQSARAYVEIQKSDMSDEDKAGYMAQVDSNPDNLLLMFEEYNALTEQLTGEGGDKLKEGERENLLNKLAPVVSGDFDAYIDPEDGYSLRYVDKETGNDFSVQELRNHLHEVKKEYGEQVSEINRFNTASANNVFNQKPGTMIEMGPNGLYKHRDKAELWPTYQNLASNVGGGLSDERLEEMYIRDKRGADFLLEQENARLRAAREKDDDVKDRTEPWNVELGHNIETVKVYGDNAVVAPQEVPQITGGSVGWIPARGTTGFSQVNFVDPATGQPVSGAGLDIEYDGNGEVTGVNVITVDAKEVENAMEGAGIQNISDEILFRIYADEVVHISFVTGTEYDQQNKTLIKGFAKTLVDRIKSEVTSTNAMYRNKKAKFN